MFMSLLSVITCFYATNLFLYETICKHEKSSVSALDSTRSGFQTYGVLICFSPKNIFILPQAQFYHFSI